VQLDQLSVVLRQRNPWEAIDLGIAMAREWWRDTYAAWLAVFVPLSVAACWLLPPQWAFVLVWWLEPALDRIILHVVSSAVFGSRPRLRETLRSFFSYGRNGLLLSLVPPLRFSLSRSFGLPVRQLENARGHTARLRANQLRKRAMNQAMWLTLVCLMFEVVVFFSLIGLYDLLVPAATQDSFDPFELFQGTPSHARAYLLVALYLGAIALIEPLYVAGGFALYLNRRMALEGWDLEVQLRRIAQRDDQLEAKEPAAARSAVVVLVALGIGFTVLLALPVLSSAQDTSSRPDTPAPHISEAAKPASLPPSQAKQQIREVLQQPQFEEFETQIVIEPLRKPEKEKPRPSDTGLASFLQFIAEVLRGVVWVLLGAVLLYALYWILRRLNWIRPAEPTWTPPSTLFGLDVRPESLPEDVAAAAAQLARSGNAVGALSLLYRGALVALLHRDQIELAGGDTEVDCLTKTRERVAAPTYAYLARLLAAWQAAAYAHRMPPLPEVEQLASEWPGLFRAEPA
jgi:hypothetical protein